MEYYFSFSNNISCYAVVGSFDLKYWDLIRFKVESVNYLSMLFASTIQYYFI